MRQLAGDHVLFAIDDTPTARYGPKVQGAGIHRNPMPGPAGAGWNPEHRASVGPTCVGPHQGGKRGGHIGQRNQRRRVGPTQAAEFGLGASGNPTDAGNAKARLAFEVSDRSNIRHHLPTRAYIVRG